MDITVDGTDTLDSVAAKINSSGARVNAAVIFDGTNYRLQVSGTDSGVDNAVTFTETGTTLGVDDPANELVAAADAVFEIDGLAMTRGHGDLGMVSPDDDVLLALSWSGETVELKSLVEYSRRFRIPLLAVTARRDSTLARQADVVLTLPRADEACPHGLAPTTSSLMQLALGDALAITLLESRGFTAEKFREFHPDGQLGASLRFVREIMHTGAAVPLVGPETPMGEAIVAMTEKGFGCLGIAAGDGSLVGIITDGDLRRHLGPDLLLQTVDDVMTKAPKTIPPDMLAGAALDLLNQAKITTLFVVEESRPIGIVHLHDFLRAGVA